MITMRYADGDFESRLGQLFNRTAFPADVEAVVAGILAGVRERGDAAVVEYAAAFDRVALTPAQFAVDEAEIRAAAAALPAAVKRAIRLAYRQIRGFSARRRPRDWSYSPRRGVRLGERFVPLSRVGVYVPGGTAPLVSTMLHTVTLAATAGVQEIVVVTPPGPDRTVNPALLYAARCAGATEVYRLGGVYAIGALAFGTPTVRKVEKIVGPGNAYVTAAKRQVYGYVALDLVAGPSEVMILADDSADARFIAADMLSQAEHGSGREQAVLVTPDADLIRRVRSELGTQAADLRRQSCVRQVLETGVFLIQVRDLDQAVELAGRYAPEHLEIITRRPETVARRITAAGAVFLGPWTPEPIGDFVAGPSHVLPTGGAARYFSGLTVDQFYRRMSVIRYDRRACLSEGRAVATFAAVEGLDAHGRSVAVRRTEEL